MGADPLEHDVAEVFEPLVRVHLDDGLLNVLELDNFAIVGRLLVGEVVVFVAGFVFDRVVVEERADRDRH
eukprot:CAMPEP_0116940476 /NCGR_PEP_ID=MMETSP0467-20121206/33390_1 /TAXON_ID=283647 /ORGANISM="Mesodinium pulex, Strain SPMC105" /LENGTH=69 /DNA_ID=CAMNT_0004623025 /DNA_START=181 /DNA_END=390 /DNA_ORIENTATION=-